MCVCMCECARYCKLQVHTGCIVYNVPLSRLQASEDLSARLKGLLRHNRLQLEVCGL